MPNHIFNKTHFIGTAHGLEQFKKHTQAYQLQLLEGPLQRPTQDAATFFKFIEQHHVKLREETTHEHQSTTCIGVPKVRAFSFNFATPMPPSLMCSEGSQGALGLSLVATEEQIQALSQRKHSLFTSDLRHQFERFQKRAEEQKIPNVPAIYSKEALVALVRLLEPEVLELGQVYLNNLTQYGHTSWYNWSIENWGTKWDAYDVAADFKEQKNALTITYSTAWSPPIAALAAFAQKFHMPIATAYHDEGGNFSGCSLLLPKGWIIPSEVLEQMPQRVKAKLQLNEQGAVEQTQEVVFSDRQGRMSGILGDVSNATKLLKQTLEVQNTAVFSSSFSDKCFTLMVRKMATEQPLDTWLPALTKKRPDIMGNGAFLFDCTFHVPNIKPTYFFDLCKQLQIDVNQPIPSIGKSFAQLWALSGFTEGITFVQQQKPTAQDSYAFSAFAHAFLLQNESALIALRDRIRADQMQGIPPISAKTFSSFPRSFLHLALYPACPLALRKQIFECAQDESRMPYKIAQRKEEFLPQIQALIEQQSLNDVVPKVPKKAQKMGL